jgi:type VI secretion system protein ImpE
MLAEQLVQAGDLPAALKALQDAVRQQPSSARHRVFLFQLLCVLGDWPRALTQLNVAAELDAATLPMAQTYREAIQCEALRMEVFAGRRTPLVFGAPPAWLAQLSEALKYDAIDPVRAADARAAAFEAAPASAGTIDTTRFDWLADADGRLGPTLEAIVNGRYLWIPFTRIARIEIEPPADLRDAVWTAAAFKWTNGAQTVGLIPTRYPGTAAARDDALKLARRTEWHADLPLGQRMFASDSGDHALMDVRAVEFDAAADDDTQDDSHG